MTRHDLTPKESAIVRLCALPGINTTTAARIYDARKRRTIPATAFGYGKGHRPNVMGITLRAGLVEWIEQGATVRLTDKARNVMKGGVAA